MPFAQLVVAANRDDNIREGGYDIANDNRYEGEPNVNCCEVPLRKKFAECFNEREDESVAEAAEQAQKKHDRLSNEHLELHDR